MIRVSLLPLFSCFGPGRAQLLTMLLLSIWSMGWRLSLMIFWELGSNPLHWNSFKERREWLKHEFPRATLVWENNLCSCRSFLSTVYLGNSFLLLPGVILSRHIFECWLVPVFALFLENALHTWILKDLQTQSSVSPAASHKVRIEMAWLMLWALLGGGEGQQVTGGSVQDVF